MGVVVIFALAVALAVVPPLVDRWALRRGASSETLAALAATTLAGVVAVPLTFAVCTGFLAAHDRGRDGLSLAAASGLLLVAVAAGRTVARMLGIRRRWRALSGLSAALGLRQGTEDVAVLPVSESLAFVSGTEAFISQGLIDRLTPQQRQAVIEHEREHARRRHARLLATARALTHGAFGLYPARHATGVLDRELDTLADQAAARRLGDPRAVREALQTLAAGGDGRVDSPTQTRIDRLSSNAQRHSLVDAAVRLVALALGALLVASVCLSIHTGSAWLGAGACMLFAAGFLSLIRPVLTTKESFPKPEGAPNARRPIQQDL